MKKFMTIMLTGLLSISMYCLNSSIVFAKEESVMYGGGEKGSDYTEEDLETDKRRMEEVNDLDKLRIDPDGEEYLLNVPVFEQINNYYCGPATTKQIVHYLKGTSATQNTYASELGTNSTVGTYANKFAPLLSKKTGKTYVYVPNGTTSEWTSKIKYGMLNKQPAVLNINTNNVSGFPYKSSGHYVNTSGTSTLSGNYKVRITDPYGPGLGNKWYLGMYLYDACMASSSKSITY